MRNISGTSYGENQKTRFFLIDFFSNNAVHEKMWKNIVEQGGPHMKIRRFRVA
jgi:hypothetical protein